MIFNLDIDPEEESNLLANNSNNTYIHNLLIEARKKIQFYQSISMTGLITYPLSLGNIPRYILCIYITS